LIAVFPSHTKQAPELLAEFESLARQKGVLHIGYTSLPQHAVFKGMIVLYDNVIVMTQEMDREAIKSAPSIEGYNAVGPFALCISFIGAVTNNENVFVMAQFHGVYKSLGAITMEMTAWLQIHG
jgi:hypothetical protein